MLSYIHRNYMEKITLEEIASSASVSGRECLRCFRSTINKSPVEYLMDYRLEMAKKTAEGYQYDNHRNRSSDRVFVKCIFREGVQRKVWFDPSGIQKKRIREEQWIFIIGDVCVC